MENKTIIITCAITGSIHTPSLSEYLPWKPKDIAQHAIDAANAGAASVHIHARNPENGAPTQDLNIFHQIVDAIREKSDALICLTTGGGVGMTVEERMLVVPEFKPELASMNAGSINFGIFPLSESIKEPKFEWEKSMLESTKNFVSQNSFATLERMCEVMKENGTKPELEIYDVGHLYNVQYLLKIGMLEEPLFLQFVTGIMGGIGATIYDLMYLHQTADRLFGPGNYNWSAIGAGKMEFTLCTTSLFLGGHVRVGMEDNLYLSKGVMAKNNAQLVEKMVRIMREFGFEPATASEAKEILIHPSGT